MNSLHTKKFGLGHPCAGLGARTTRGRSFFQKSCITDFLEFLIIPIFEVWREFTMKIFFLMLSPRVNSELDKSRMYTPFRLSSAGYKKTESSQFVCFLANWELSAQNTIPLIVDNSMMKKYFSTIFYILFRTQIIQNQKGDASTLFFSTQNRHWKLEF